MSKERLEEIQKEVNYAYRRDGSINTKAVTMHIEHYEYLYEQVERAQELEEEVDRLKVWYGAYHRETKATSRLRDENKRYREALEAIAYFDDKEEGEVATRIDVKYIARKALEGEK